MKRAFLLVVLLAAAASGSGSDSPASQTFEIHELPAKLLSGKVLVEVGLGTGGGPADLFLNGARVCTPTPSQPRCTVDLGPGLHVQILELVRFDDDGRITSRAVRWLNRPGEEVDLNIDLAARPVGSTCGGRLRWDSSWDPASVESSIRVGQDRWEVSSDGRTFGYPCPAGGSTAVVRASAVFPDGRRAVAATLAGSDGRPAGDIGLPAAFVDEEHSCERVAASLGPMFREEVAPGLDAVIVLDPAADYRALASIGGAPALDGDPWQIATESFSDAEHLWFVTPDLHLLRSSAFSAGRESWFGQLMSAGFAGVGGQRRLGDAVASAGLLAAADARRRAVILVLGPNATADGGEFSAAEAVEFLTEISVPLEVIRTGPASSDGWPVGQRVSNLGDLARAMSEVRRKADAQCVGWLRAGVESRRVPGLLPDGAETAGLSESGLESMGSIWRFAGGIDDAPESRKTFSGERVEVTAVTVLVTARNDRDEAVGDLAAADLEVREDGRSMPVLGLAPVQSSVASPVDVELPSTIVAPQSPPDQAVPVAIYVDRQLSGSMDIVPALQALAVQSEWLCSLGPVDVVIAGDVVEEVLQDVRNVEEVRRTLEQLAAEPEGGHAIERIRKRYLRDLRKYPGSPVAGPGSDISGSAPDNRTRLMIMNGARSAIYEEDALLRRSAARVNDWALSKPADVPRVLFVVGAGFDENPADFYVPLIEQRERHLVAEARSEFVKHAQVARYEMLGRELAASGWMVIPVASRVAGMMTTTAEMSGGERFQAFLSTGFDDGAAASEVQSLLLNPVGPQWRVAEPSGGEVAMGASGLREVVDRSAGWYRLTYQAARAPDGRIHDLEITTERDEVEIRTTGVIAAGESEGRAERRLRNLSAGGDDRGDLPVVIAVSDPRYLDDGEIEASLTVWVDFETIAPLFVESGSRPIRFSVLTTAESSLPFWVHRVELAVGAVGGLQYTLPIRWPGGNIEVVVSAEDLGSGAWGGAVRQVEGKTR